MSLPPLPDPLDPASLFGTLWPVVQPHTSSIIEEPWDVSSYPETANLYSQLVEHDGDELPLDYGRYLIGESRSTWHVRPEDDVKRAFVAMRAIDRAFRFVAPGAAPTWPRAATVKPGRLIRRMKERWLAEGAFAVTAAGHVLLTGPLTGSARAEAPEVRNGDLFEHQFVNLTVIPALTAPRRVKFATVMPSDFRPVAGRPLAIGVSPIATGSDDLHFQPCKRGSTCYLDALPADSTVVADRAAGAISNMLGQGATVVALPELTLDGPSVEQVRSAMRTGAHDGGRLVVLGSALSGNTAPGSSLSYNEAVVCDGRGRVLFRQRKLNHYTMSEERMRECRIPAAEPAPHVENCAAGSELVICDLPGLGRVLVLICEDLAQENPGRQVARLVSPDMIVTPILDLSITPGRWTHQKAFSLESGSKFVVSGSTTLSARKAGAPALLDLDPDTGVALLFDGGTRKAGHVVKVGALTGHGPEHVVQWDPDDWKVTWVDLKDP